MLWKADFLIKLQNCQHALDKVKYNCIYSYSSELLFMSI